MKTVRRQLLGKRQKLRFCGRPGSTASTSIMQLPLLSTNPIANSPKRISRFRQPYNVTPFKFTEGIFTNVFKASYDQKILKNLIIIQHKNLTPNLQFTIIFNEAPTLFISKRHYKIFSSILIEVRTYIDQIEDKYKAE